MKSDLFCNRPPPASIPIKGAEVELMYDFLSSVRADEVLRALIENTPWRTENVVMWGKQYRMPRLTAWYGDTGCMYAYSGIAMQPLPWTPLLRDLRSMVEDACSARFNSVLLNYYRHQRDSMGMHSDDESELGQRPTIASLSLGEERVLKFVPRRGQRLQPASLALPSGSLLLMKGDTQRNWKHGIAKSGRHMGPRVNLTFRQIVQAGEPPTG